MASTLKVDRGTTYTIDYVFKRNGVVASLAGATIRFTMKTTEWDTDTDDSDALLLKNVTDGTAEGTAEIVIDPADTATMTPGDYYFDIKVELPSGEIYKTAEGKIKLDGSPTNRLS